MVGTALGGGALARRLADPHSGQSGCRPAGAVPLAGRGHPRLRRPGADPRRGRARHPRRPRRRPGAPGRLPPDVRRAGDDPHERRTRRRGPRVGDGRRNADPGRSISSSPSPIPSGRSRRSMAPRSPSRATINSPRCWPRWPEAIGATPVKKNLATTAPKAACRAAAVLAASGFNVTLSTRCAVRRVAGLGQARSLAICGPLIEGSNVLSNKASRRRSLGPMTPR